MNSTLSRRGIRSSLIRPFEYYRNGTSSLEPRTQSLSHSPFSFSTWTEMLRWPLDWRWRNISSMPRLRAEGRPCRGYQTTASLVCDRRSPRELAAAIDTGSHKQKDSPTKLRQAGRFPAAWRGDPSASPPFLISLRAEQVVRHAIYCSLCAWYPSKDYSGSRDPSPMNRDPQVFDPIAESASV